MSCGRAKAIRYEAALFSVFVMRMQVLCQWLWVLRVNVGRATKCRSSFRPVALCLAEIEPFYWPPDSSNAMTGFV